MRVILTCLVFAIVHVDAALVAPRAPGASMLSAKQVSHITPPKGMPTVEHTKEKNGGYVRGSPLYNKQEGIRDEDEDKHPTKAHSALGMGAQDDVELGSPLKLQKVSLAEYPNAVCNDGSAAAYYISQPTNTTVGWHVYLEGGGWCYSAESCQKKWSSSPHLMSSKDYPDNLSLSQGIFENSARNPLLGWNRVYLKYCSQDAHMGDAEQFGYSFRGQRIVEAMFKDLVKRGLGDVPAQTLLFSGCSAGGRGAMVTADYVEGILAAAGVAHPVNVLALMDGALYVSEPPAMKEGATNMIDQAREVYKHLNVTSRVPVSCRERYADTPWYCIFGEYRLPLVATKHILTHQQYDFFAMISQGSHGALGTGSPPFTTTQMEWFESYRKSIFAFMKVTPPVGSIYFSTACYEHCFTDTNLMWTQKVDGFSLGEVLAKFLGNQPVVPPALVDDCEGFDCTCAEADSKHRVFAVAQTIYDLMPWLLCLIVALVVAAVVAYNKPWRT